MSAELRACPFCDGPPQEFVGGSHGGVECGWCEATIDVHPVSGDAYEGLESAKLKWNRRSGPEARAEGQSTTEGGLTANPATVSQRAESETSSGGPERPREVGA